MNRKEIQKLLAEDQLILGTRETEKALRRGELQKILLASNIPENLKERFLFYKEQGYVDVEVLNLDSEELGITCKRPFTILVVGVKRTTKKSKK